MTSDLQTSIKGCVIENYFSSYRRRIMTGHSQNSFIEASVGA